MATPLIPVYAAVGARRELGAWKPLDPMLAGYCSSRRGSPLCEALLDERLWRLRRLPGLYSAVIAAAMLIELLGEEFELIYLDVGSRLSPARPGGIFVLKEAEILVNVSRDGVREEARHPVTPPYGSLLVLPAGSRAERVRQAAMFVAEVARVYQLLKECLEGRVPRLVFKHGPLGQLIGIYLNPVFTANPRLYRAVLLYAGLDASEAERLIDDALVEDGVNAGVLAAMLLEGIARLMLESLRRGVVCAGFGLVEDTSSSRHLSTQLIAEALYALTQLRELSIDRIAERLLTWIESGLESIRARHVVCLDEESWGIDARSFVDELLGRLGSRALSWGYTLQALLSEPDLLAAAVYQEASGLDIGDAPLLLHANYLEGLAVTEPFMHTAWRRLLRRAASERVSEYPKVYERMKTISESIAPLYSYALPGPPPTCRQLSSRLGRLGAPPWLLAGLALARQPVRIDTIVSTSMPSTRVGCWGGKRDALDCMADILVSAAALTQLASTVSAYGLPPGVIMADVRSRVRLDEALILAELARRLAGRLVPYGVVLRHWPRTGAAT